MLGCFKTLFRHQIAQYRGEISKNVLLGGGSAQPETPATPPPPATANFFEVCAVMRVNPKIIKKRFYKWGKHFFLENGGGGGIISKQNIHPCVSRSTQL